MDFLENWRVQLDAALSHLGIIIAVGLVTFLVWDRVTVRYLLAAIICGALGAIIFDYWFDKEWIPITAAILFTVTGPVTFTGLEGKDALEVIDEAMDSLNRVKNAKLAKGKKKSPPDYDDLE